LHSQGHSFSGNNFWLYDGVTVSSFGPKKLQGLSNESDMIGREVDVRIYPKYYSNCPRICQAFKIYLEIFHRCPLRFFFFFGLCLREFSTPGRCRPMYYLNHFFLFPQAILSLINLCVRF
jgi:hypothetical protein